jgi:hypothetical protein
MTEQSPERRRGPKKGSNKNRVFKVQVFPNNGEYVSTWLVQGCYSPKCVIEALTREFEIQVTIKVASKSDISWYTKEGGEILQYSTPK